jgi:hypothetical protein
MRRNRPQREQMPDSSVQCMWSSKSQITNEPLSHLCPEHVCTLCNGEELPKGHNHNICPRAECQTCKLFGHVAKDCVYTNCLDVDVEWFNLLFTKVIEDDTPVKETIESTGGYRNNLLHVDQVVVGLLHFNGKWGPKYDRVLRLSVEFTIDGRLCASCKRPSLPNRRPCRCGPSGYRNSRPPRSRSTATATSLSESDSERTLC